MPGNHAPAVERFKRYVDDAGDCHLWTGQLNRAGYGVFRVDSQKKVLAHRFVLFVASGHWPEEVDHLCRVRRCVRAEHLEEVTHAENMRRKPHPEVCPQGHPYDEKNTYVLGRFRHCRACQREIANRRYAARKVGV